LLLPDRQRRTRPAPSEPRFGQSASSPTVFSSGDSLRASVPAALVYLGQQVGRLRERRRRVFASDEKRGRTVPSSRLTSRRPPWKLGNDRRAVGGRSASSARAIPPRLHRQGHVDQIPASGRRVSCTCSPARVRSAPAPPPSPEIATDSRRRSLRRLTTCKAGDLVRTPATRPHRVRDVSWRGVELAGRRPGWPRLRSSRGRP